MKTKNISGTWKIKDMKERTVCVSNHDIEVGGFRRAMLLWGRENFRSLPWRQSRDPYEILIAEIMLHRTKASQVLPVYLRFLQRYPSIENLAGVEKEELHTVMSSLGLRHRVDILHDMVAEITNRFGGRVPVEKEDLLSLPGVSDYIAGAVRCFARNEPEPIVDTNTVRIIGRLFGLRVTDSSRRNKVFKGVISALLDPEEPRAYNFALLDLANLVCTKVRLPACQDCPVQNYCLYGSNPFTPKSTR